MTSTTTNVPNRTSVTDVNNPTDGQSTKPAEVESTPKSKYVVGGIDMTGVLDQVEQFSAQVSSAQPDLSLPPPPPPPPSLAAIASELSWPPGGAGELAKLLFSLAIRPVMEIAIATALALLAGICGRAWNTHTGAGLNLYVIVVARSGIGKEAIADGIGMLVSAAKARGGNLIAEFVVFDSIASGPALVKLLAVQPCFLHIAGEFGHEIAYMATDKSGPYATLRQQITKVFSKSSPTSIGGGVSYSDAENNVTTTESISYSLIGETTPGTLFEALSSAMMGDGFLSRFLIIDYDGPRGPENRQVARVSEAWATWLSNLAFTAYRQITPVAVQPSSEARNAFETFGLECDTNINATSDETRRQMWNRAQLKALKLGGLLAIADDPAHPQTSLEQALWAIGLVKLDVAKMTARLDRGDIGDDDQARRQKVLGALHDWLQQPLADTYLRRRGWPEMKHAGTVPRIYLTNRLQSLPTFRNYRLGAVAAIDATINSLIKDGVLAPVERSRVTDRFGFHGDAYRILSAG